MYFTENVPDIKRVAPNVHKGTIDVADMHQLVYQRNQAGDGFYVCLLIFNFLFRVLFFSSTWIVSPDHMNFFFHNETK